MIRDVRARKTLEYSENSAKYASTCQVMFMWFLSIKHLHIPIRSAKKTGLVYITKELLPISSTSSGQFIFIHEDLVLSCLNTMTTPTPPSLQEALARVRKERERAQALLPLCQQKEKILRVCCNDWPSKAAFGMWLIKCLQIELDLEDLRAEYSDLVAK